MSVSIAEVLLFLLRLNGCIKSGKYTKRTFDLCPVYRKKYIMKQLEELTSSPLISVVTVSYNAVSTIEETILSVINQTYDNIEYIIIDGGSTDGTVDVIKKYEHRIAYWVSEPDKGIYDAMNKGIDRARGEWVNFMNADDWFYSLHIVKSVVSLRYDKYDVVYGCVNFLYNGYSKVIVPRQTPSKNNPMPFNHQSAFVRRRLLLEKHFDISFKFAADYNFFCKILPIANYCFYKEVIASYSLHGVSSSNGILVNLERIKSNPCLYNYYKYLLYFRNKLVKKILTFVGIKDLRNLIFKYGKVTKNNWNNRNII